MVGALHQLLPRTHHQQTGLWPPRKSSFSQFNYTSIRYGDTVLIRWGFHRPARAKYKYGDVVADIQDLGEVSTYLALQNASGIDGNVHCRGARLRPWGPIRLRALTLHSSAATQLLPPAFPLLFHEGLVFRQVIQCAVDMKVLEEHLRGEVVKLQLTQGPEDVLLAQLTTSLSRLLFPKHPLKSLPDGTELELLMTPTSRFQSAVGPRIELSTRMLAELCSQEESLLTDVCHGSCLKPQVYFPEPPAPCPKYRSRQVTSHYDIVYNDDKFCRKTFDEHCTKCLGVEKSADFSSYLSSDNFQPEYLGYLKNTERQQLDIHRCRVKGTPICDICSAYDKVMKGKFPYKIHSWINKC